MTKSKMRIYKGRGYSDHEVFLGLDYEGVAYYLCIATKHENIQVPLDDILNMLQPVDEALKNED